MDATLRPCLSNTPSPSAPYSTASTSSTRFIAATPSLHLGPLYLRCGRRRYGCLQDLSEEMQWLAMPQNSYQEKQKLGETFRCEQCPTFVIIDPEGNVVTTEGTEIVNKDSDGIIECVHDGGVYMKDRLHALV